MSDTLTLPFIKEFCARWIAALNDIWNYLLGDTVADVLDDVYWFLDELPLVEPLQLLVAIIEEIANNNSFGDLTLLEFILGFGFGLYLIITIFKWILL